jgi:hypothetical protein
MIAPHILAHGRCDPERSVPAVGATGHQTGIAASPFQPERALTTAPDQAPSSRW